MLNGEVRVGGHVCGERKPEPARTTRGLRTSQVLGDGIQDRVHESSAGEDVIVVFCSHAVEIEGDAYQSAGIVEGGAVG